MIETNVATSTVWKSSRITWLKIRKADAFEIIMMEYLVMLGLFSRWVEHSRIWRLILLILFAFLLSKKKFTHRLRQLVVSFWFLIPVVLFILSGLAGESREYFFFNLNRITWPLIIATSIAIIISTKPNIVYELFDKNFIFLNFIWIINIIVLTIQCSGTPLFIKSAWLEVNPYYKDQCCGLFGNSGTHELSAFSIFMVMYDLYMGLYRKKGLIGIITIGFAFATGGITLVLSTQNDNMTLLFILPAFFMLFYLQRAQWSGKKPGTKFMRMLKYIIPIVLLFVIVIQIPAISQFIYDKVIGRIERMIHYNSTGILGSNVRTAAVAYAFTEGKGWLLGYGVGTWPFAEGAAEEFFHGFSNFGLNSMSAFLMLGGIWLYLSSVALFARYLYLATYRKKETDGYFFVCLGVVIIFTFYTVLFNSFQSMLWLMMTFIVFGFCRDIILNKRNRKIL